MTVTRGQAFTHILDNILVLQQDAPLRLAFDELGVDSPQDILEIHEDDLKDLELTVAAGNVTKLKQVDIKKIICLQKWYADQPVHDLDTWIACTAEGFEEWRVRVAVQQHQVIVAPNPITATPSVAKPDSALTMFKKSQCG
jgi:hypothetical protein